MYAGLLREGVIMSSRQFRVFAAGYQAIQTDKCGFAASCPAHYSARISGGTRSTSHMEQNYTEARY